MFGVTARHVPPPEGISAPTLWGSEKVVRERLGAYATKIETVRRLIVFDYPGPPRHVVQFFRDYFGPTQVAFSRLDATGQAGLAGDLEKLWDENNQGEKGRTRVSNEYLEVIATRA